MAKGKKLQAGKYEIEKVLRIGGFGIIYQVLEFKLNHCELVAIKTTLQHLPPEKSNKYERQLIAEAEKLKRLSQFADSHIVGFRESFQEEKTFCLVMDLIGGENLFQIVKNCTQIDYPPYLPVKGFYQRLYFSRLGAFLCQRFKLNGRIPEDKILRYIRQIGLALSLMHEQGLVHRDVHPGNIMINKEGKAFLIDFGIAKEIDTTKNNSTDLAGNSSFAPYEQLSRGSSQPNLDVYSLAATLYYAVTGKPPIGSLDRKMFDVPLIEPKKLNSSISDRLNQAIMRGMALEPEHRPQSMNEWLQYLPRVTEYRPESQLVKKLPRSTNLPYNLLGVVLLYYIGIGFILSLFRNPFLFGSFCIALNWSFSVNLTWVRESCLDLDRFLLFKSLNIFSFVAILAMIISIVEVSVLPLILSMLPLVLLISMLITRFILWVTRTILAILKVTQEILELFNMFKGFIIFALTSELGLFIGWLLELLRSWYW